MQEIIKRTTLQDVLKQEREHLHTIGLVPTMGALHQGHMSLVKQCLRDNEVCVVSLFLNPTQFNDPKDLETYPVDHEADLRRLREAGVHYVFSPTVEEMYPEGDVEERFELGSLAELMEGQYRPGHFQGVCQIVSKLFQIVKPDKAYFGEKDFQQLAVVRTMLKQLPELSVEIIPCPTVRESSGLAMSSRNQRLSPQERQQAAEIYRILKQSRLWAEEGLSLAELKQKVEAAFQQAENLRLEYFSVVDALSLQEINSWEETQHAVGCVSVFCSSVRLIDHIHYPARRCADSSET